jgi:glutathione S-transferase
VFSAGEEWARLRRPALEERLRQRLSRLAEALGERDYLEGRFTVGDLMMASVLGILRDSPLIAEQPNLAAYLARCDARPAYRRALAAHLADLRD